VTVGDDKADLAGLLAEDLFQAHHDRLGQRKSGGGRDEIVQHGTRADGRELVDISHEKEMGMLAQPRDDLVHQPEIDHRGLIDDEHLLLNRFRRSPIGLRSQAEEAVDCGCRSPGGRGQLFGSTPGGCTQGIRHLQSFQAEGERADGGGFSCAGTPCENHQMAARQERLYGLTLLPIQACRAYLCDEPFRRLRRLPERLRRRTRHPRRQPFGHA